MDILSLEEQISQLKQEKEFIQNLLSDLLGGMETELDRATRIRVIEACGRGCFNRFDFKQNIARRGQGSLENLMAAYWQNFEIWRDGDLVHIRYGETSSSCYCPAARFRPAQADDLHCECTRPPIRPFSRPPSGGRSRWRWLNQSGGVGRPVILWYTWGIPTHSRSHGGEYSPSARPWRWRLLTN